MVIVVSIFQRNCLKKCTFSNCQKLIHNLLIILLLSSNKKFINVPGKVIYNGDKFLIKIRKTAHTPILKDVAKLQNPIAVPWPGNNKLEIIWTP